MSAVNFDRFTDPLFLKQIGRPLLTSFLTRFQPALEARSLLLPPPEALDHEYFNLLAHLLMTPEGLPAEMSEAIHTINEMASPEGQQRIEQLAADTGGLEAGEDCTHGDLAMRLWLHDPALLARARMAHRLLRLSTFHHFGCAQPGREPRSGIENTDALAAWCDAWFARHNRGRHNTRVEVFVLPTSGSAQGSLHCEYWFVIRHGETFARTPKVERGRTEVLHFRPAKDDVVVFNPARNEIRINARTLGERDLYRAAFGEHIFNDPDAFSERKAYMLSPLRTEGQDALDSRGIDRLMRVVLRGLEIAIRGARPARIICKAQDVFASGNLGGCPIAAIPGADLTQAWFDCYFEGCKLPRPVQLRPPNTLRLSRHADAAVVEAWLCARGFRISRTEDATRTKVQ